MAVTRLDVAFSDGSDTAGTFSYTVSAGSDRCLVVCVSDEGALTEDNLSVTYGTESMTKQANNFLEAGSFDNQGTIFTLNETGLTAASSTTCVVSGLLGNDFTVHSASYEGCDQTNLATPGGLDSTSAQATSSTPNPITSVDVTASDGSVVVGFGTCGSPETSTWGGTIPLTQQTDERDEPSGSPTAAGSLADRLTSAETVDVECTWNAQNRATITTIEIPEVSGGAPDFPYHLIKQRRRGMKTLLTI